MDDLTTPPAETPGQPSTPSSIVNADGTLVENWHTFAPEGYEDLRDDKTLPRIKRIWDLGKSYVHVRKQVPLEKIARPNENFTEADWNEFYEAGGRPKTAEDYNITKPKDFPKEYWDDNRSKGFQKLFHKLGLSKKQCDDLVKYNNEEVLKSIQTQNQQEEAEFQELNDKLHQKWGAAYDQKVHIGNLAIEKGSNGDLEYKERLLDKINADPDLIEFASNLGNLFTESRIIETPKMPTPADIDAKISEAMQHPAYMNGNHPDHKRQVKLVQQMFEQKEKMKVKTG